MTKRELTRFNQLLDIGRRNIEVKYFNKLNSGLLTEQAFAKTNFDMEMQMYNDAVKIIKRYIL